LFRVEEDKARILSLAMFVGFVCVNVNAQVCIFQNELSRAHQIKHGVRNNSKPTTEYIMVETFFSVCVCVCVHGLNLNTAWLYISYIHTLCS